MLLGAEGEMSEACFGGREYLRRSHNGAGGIVDGSGSRGYFARRRSSPKSTSKVCPKVRNVSGKRTASKKTRSERIPGVI